MTDERLDEPMKIEIDMIKTIRWPIWRGCTKLWKQREFRGAFCSATFVRKCHRLRIQYCRGERAALSGREGNLTLEFRRWNIATPLFAPFLFPSLLVFVSLCHKDNEDPRTGETGTERSYSDDYAKTLIIFLRDKIDSHRRNNELSLLYCDHTRAKFSSTFSANLNPNV